MGTFDLFAKQLKELTLRNGSRLLVIASSQYTDLISAESRELPGLKIFALNSDEHVPADLLQNPSMVVVEVDPRERKSLDRLTALRTANANVPIVAAIRDADVSLVRTLVREGITDVVSLPFDFDELLQVSLDAAARHDSRPQEQSLAPLIAVARSIGGCGATSIATHLAVDLAAHAPDNRGAVIADFDVQFGSVADYLGVKPHGHIGDLLEAKGRLDEDLLRSVAASAGHGVSVIAAPEAIMPLESVDSEAVLQLLKLMRKQYGYVLLDLPANWTDWTLSAANAADAIVLVVELSIPSLRQAKRRLELFRSIGIDDQIVQIVINRAEKRLFRSIDLDDVAQTLQHEVLGSVALDAPLVATAQTQGHFVGDIQRKSRFLADIARIGEQLRDGALTRRRA